MDIILYSTHCPRCEVLKQRLDAINIQYTECNDIDEMAAEGILCVPMLSVNGEMFDYVHALKWISGREEV